MTLNIDKAGRVVLPKYVRDTLHLAPGDSLNLNVEGDQIRLTPVRPEPSLRKELGVWVYYSESDEIGSLVDWLDEEREKRNREILGLP